MASTYTFTVKPPASETTGSKTESHYANQPVDGSRIAIQAIGNGFQTTDATASPQSSPLTLTSSVTTVNIPESAIIITLLNSGATNNLYFSEVSGMASYGVLNSGQSQSIDVANQTTIYLKSASGTTCSFWFTII